MLSAACGPIPKTEYRENPQGGCSARAGNRRLPDPALPVITEPGDIWQLGRHRVMCGDALSGADLAELMQGDLAGVSFTDPPRNVLFNGHVCGKSQLTPREFVQGSGEMSKEACTRFLTTSLALGARHSQPGGVRFACMDWRHTGDLADHPTAKPVAMVRDALMDVSARGGTVPGPFLGAGATLLAAKATGRIALGLELDPAYVDLTLRRWRRATGNRPVRQSDCRTLVSMETGSVGEVAS